MLQTKCLLLPPPLKYVMTEDEVSEVIRYSASTLSTRRCRPSTKNAMPMPMHAKLPSGKVVYRGHDILAYMLEHDLISIDHCEAYTRMIVEQTAATVNTTDIMTQGEAA
jgi:hypothetical protein